MISGFHFSDSWLIQQTPGFDIKRITIMILRLFELPVPLPLYAVATAANSHQPLPWKTVHPVADVTFREMKEAEWVGRCHGTADANMCIIRNPQARGVALQPFFRVGIGPGFYRLSGVCI